MQIKWCENNRKLLATLFEIVYEVLGHKHVEFVETNDYKRLVQNLTKLVL